MITYSKRENNKRIITTVCLKISMLFIRLVDWDKSNSPHPPTIPLHQFRQGIEEVKIVAELSSQKTKICD
jgi:hypothetical protein